MRRGRRASGADEGEDLLRGTFRATIDAIGRRSAAAAPEPGRRRERRVGPAKDVLRVVDRGGVLFLEAAADAGAPGPVRRRRLGPLEPGTRVVAEVPFERLERSQITSALDTLDTRLGAARDLRELRAGRLIPIARPRTNGRVLLLIHGTFSSGDNLVAEFHATGYGREFLAGAERSYDQVLTFDHPTLGVSPILNARRLAQLLAGSRAHVDVIAHSRGGLVARWWAEVFDRAPAGARRRLVLVGAPLAGTGLAAPPNLREGLSLLANVGRALGGVAGLASAAVPFLTVASGLFQVFASVTSLLAATPVVDAAIALVPGLAAMSRVSNNPELLSLRLAPAGRTVYRAVQANFETEDPGWAFWRRFRRLPEAAAAAVFDGPNDLVVDTASMAELGPGRRLRPGDVLDFGRTSEVHHCSYFRHERTLRFLERELTRQASRRG